MTETTQPTEAIIVRPQVLPSLAQFEIERQLAGRLFKARGFLPSHYFLGPEDERFAKVLAAIEYGRAVGIEPMIALQNLTNIDGKIGATALLIGAQLRKAGYKIRTSWFDQAGATVPKESPQVHGCKVVLSKDGQETGDGAFSMTDAQRAHLIKDGSGWQKYPKDMLYARALTQAGREGAQDAVLGMAYTAEELGADVDADGQPIAFTPPLGGIIDATWTDGGTPAPGVSEAAGSPPVTAIQPTPPAPPVEVEVGEGKTTAEVVTTPVPATPPQTEPPPVAPLQSTSVSRRMGSRFSSIGPAAKRTNVVEVPAPETPATAPEPAPEPQTQPEAVPSQPATVEPAQEVNLAEEVPDPGLAQYLRDLRAGLRQEAATWRRLNVIYKNHVINAVEGKPLVPVPPAEPNAESDDGLKNLIGARYPGRTLDNLGETELKSLLEIAADGVTKRRAAMLKDAVPEE